MMRMGKLKHFFSDFPILLGRLSGFEIGELLSKGVSIRKDFLPPTVCDHMVDDILRATNEESGKIWTDKSAADFRYFGAENISKDFLSFLTDPDLARIHKCYLSRKVAESFTMANRTVASDGNTGSGGGWHRDSPFSHQFKAILYLNDVSEDNGPFEYILGTHKFTSVVRAAKLAKKSLSKTRYTEEEIERLIQAGYKKKQVLGKRGTLVLVDTKVLHRGSPLKLGERFAATNYYFSRKIPEHLRINIR